MESKGIPFIEFENENWLMDLAFLVDITTHHNYVFKVKIN